MTTTLLISETKVRSFSDINNAVDSDLIRNNIRLAQDYYIQQVIGTMLYQKLLGLVETGTMNLPENQLYRQILEEYIQDYLLYCVYYETLESIFIRPRNNGLLTPQGGSESSSVDVSVYNTKRESVRTKMNYYNERLTEYIIEENSLDPELTSATKLYQQEPDYTNKYKNPFVPRKDARVDMMRKAGIPIYNSAYKQYPQ